MTELAIDVATFSARGSNPAAVANVGKFYSKTIGNITNVFYENSSGTVYQVTPVTPTSSSVIYSMLDKMTVFGTSTTIANATGAQNIFDTANDTVTLTSNTTYSFRGKYIFTRTITNSPVMRMLFGGTATFSNFNYFLRGQAFATPGLLTAHVFAHAEAKTTNSAFTGGSNGAIAFAEFNGIMVVSVGGTFIPQVSFSTLPGGTSITEPWSFIEITKLGDNSFLQQGGWA